MTSSLLLVSLAAGALTAPAPALPAAAELAIRDVSVRPATAVVGAGNSIRLVIDVVAKGVAGRNGVTVKVEPGAPPGSRPGTPGDLLAVDGSPGSGRPPGSPEPVLSAESGAVRLRSGWETWRFLPDKALNRFYPAGTWTVTATAHGSGGTSVTAYGSFQLKRETRLTARAEPARDEAGTRLRGSLTRLDPRGRTDFTPYAQQRVEILWRRSPSGAWERAAEATTTARGTFAHTATSRTGGSWRVRYPGNGQYAADTSPIQQRTS